MSIHGFDPFYRFSLDAEMKQKCSQINEKSKKSMKGFVSVMLNDIPYALKLKKITFVSAFKNDDDVWVLCVICDSQKVVMKAYSRKEAVEARGALLEALEEYESIKPLM